MNYEQTSEEVSLIALDLLLAIALLIFSVTLRNFSPFHGYFFFPEIITAYTGIPWKESYESSRQHIKKQRYYFDNKGLSSQGYGFSSSHVGMWKLDYKESWVPDNWCFWTMVLEKTLESPLDRKEIQPVHPRGDQPWVVIGRTDAEAEIPILWPSDAKNWLLWKDPDAGKDWRLEEKGMTKYEMVGWHHQLDGHGFE